MDCKICNFDQVDEENDELNSNYHDKTKFSTLDDYNNDFQNSHKMLHTIPAINIQSNQQQYLQMPLHKILNDTTNVEAVILQNQVDTLQWKLKQMETSYDMYRAVMEEVARFLDQYQNQKQLQQQQFEHHNNNTNKLDQIPRSKSLFQIYIAGGHDKSTSENNNILDNATSSLITATKTMSTSHSRARSSTNLTDLKHQQSNTRCNSKDDHIYQTGLKPSQSYSAFKDFTWRRCPKKSNARLNIAKDDVEEKLNQEAFRLLRTIQNLLNTSQHQPDLAHNHQYFQSTLQKSHLSKSSVISTPGTPMHNLTNLDANSTGYATPDLSHTLPSVTTTTSSTAINNLAPEMIFFRSANIRDSCFSLRSSTDSSVHSTSSAASSASSKVETDEEASAPFISTTNVLKHKQHHHLAGSSTEDESGFSSISSFPDIRVPLSSTLLSNANSTSKNRATSKELKSNTANKKVFQTTDSRNSTLKANVVGLPPQDMSHPWDTSSKSFHNASNKFQRFIALTNEDSNTVLWV